MERPILMTFNVVPIKQVWPGFFGYVTQIRKVAHVINNQLSFQVGSTDWILFGLKDKLKNWKKNRKCWSVDKGQVIKVKEVWNLGVLIDTALSGLVFQYHASSQQTTFIFTDINIVWIQLCANSSALHQCSVTWTNAFRLGFKSHVLQKQNMLSMRYKDILLILHRKHILVNQSSTNFA